MTKSMPESSSITPSIADTVETLILNEDLSNLDLNYVRASLKITPNDQWNVLLTFDNAADDSNAQLSKLLYANPGFPLNAIFPAASGHPGDLMSNYVGGNFYSNQADYDPKIFFKDEGVSGVVTGHLGAV